MKRLFTLSCAIALCGVQFVSAQFNFTNVNLFGGAQSAGTAIRVDDEGTTLYAAGSFDGTYNFGTFPLMCTGNNMGFVARMDNNLISWAFAFGGSSTSTDVIDVVHYNGKVYITGNYTFYMQYDQTLIYSAGGYDVFLLVLNDNGTFVSLDSYGGTSDDNISSMAIDALGNIYMAGSFSGSATFDAQTITSAGASDVFVAQLNSAGVAQWAARAGGADFDGATGLALINNQPYICGTFRGQNIMFGTNSISVTGSDYGAFMAKYNATGTCVWASKITQCANLTVKNLASSKNQLYMTGLYVNSLNIGGTNLPGNGGADIFIAAFDSAGSKVWAKKGGSSQFADEVSFIAAEEDGYCTIIGSNNSPLTFGAMNIPHTSFTEIYVVGFDLTGTAIYGKAATGLGFQRGGFAKQRGVNNFIYAGSMEQSCTFSSNVYTSPAGASFVLAEISLGSVGVNEIKEGPSLLVWVDNESQMLTASIANEDMANGALLQVCDIAGRVVYSAELNTNVNYADLSLLAKGIYTVTVQNEKINLSRKFLVQ